MRNFARIWMLATVGVGLSLAGSRGDEKITPAMTPKPVMKAFKDKFPGAKIKQISKRDEANGKTTTYEIESSRKGLDADAVLDAEGKFLEIDEQIKPDKLPPEVSSALKAKYPKVKIISAVEAFKEEKKDDKTVYEVIVDKPDGKSLEVTFDKLGKVLKEEKLGDGR